MRRDDSTPKRYNGLRSITKHAHSVFVAANKREISDSRAVHSEHGQSLKKSMRGQETLLDLGQIQFATFARVVDRIITREMEEVGLGDEYDF